MRVLSKFIFVFVFGSVGLFAQAPDTAWTRTYGGNDDDRGYSVQQTSDGGYIITGRTTSYGTGTEDVYLIRTNALGGILWTKTYGGTGVDDDDWGESVQQTSDGGFIIAGYTGFLGLVVQDVYLIKTNASGDTLWTRTYGGSGRDWGYSVQQTSDGGYIVAGEENSTSGDPSDVYLIKTDPLGDTLWTRTYGGDYYEKGRSVQQTTDGGYIVAGYTSSYGAGGTDVYLVKTNGSGATLWTRTYGGSRNDWGESVQQTSDGGYIVAGYTESYSPGEGNYDIYLIKTNSEGDTLWTKTHGGTSDDRGYSVQQTTDGGYIVAGRTSSYGAGWKDIYMVKTDSLGDLMWTKTHGGTSDDCGYSVQQTSDGGYIFGGYSSYGTSEWDVCLIKLKPEGSGIEEKITTGLFSLSPADPNPFTTEMTIQYELSKETDIDVSIYNMLGQKVKNLYSGGQSSGIHSISWDGGGTSGEKLSSGIYFLKVEAGDKEASRKVMFVR